MLHFKSCPKCLTGTMHERSGLDGDEKKCVNCAFTIYTDSNGMSDEQSIAAVAELIASA
jgi:hypothetical protein